MGVIFGKTKIYEPDYEVLKSGDYEVRLLKPGFAAEIPIGTDEEEASQTLAAYVGIAGLPNSQQVGKKIIGPYSHVAVTPPALTPDSVLQFILPSQYKEKADIPPPDHPDITIRELPERAVAVYRFSGTVDAARCDKKLRKLRAMLLRDGLLPGPAQGDDGSLDLEHTLTWDVVEYHPKVTLPAFRRNEVWIELPMQGNPAVLRLLTGRTVPGAESEPAPGAEPAEGSGELELPMKQEQPLGEKRKVSFDLSADREEDQAEHKDTIVIKEPMLPTSWKESAVPAVVYQED